MTLVRSYSATQPHHMQPSYQASKIAITQFWVGMIALELFWILMAIFTLQSPGYLILCGMAFSFIGMNLLGYYKCRSWSSQQLKQAVPDFNVMSGIPTGAAAALFQVWHRFRSHLLSSTSLPWFKLWFGALQSVPYLTYRRPLNNLLLVSCRMRLGVVKDSYGEATCTRFSTPSRPGWPEIYTCAHFRGSMGRLKDLLGLRQVQVVGKDFKAGMSLYYCRPGCA